MKNKFLVMLAVAALSLPVYHACAAGAAAAPSATATELKDLIARVNAGLQQGQRTEASQADNLKAFDDLLARHKGETNNDVAQIAFMKATLYLQVFHQNDKAIQMLKQVQIDFPNSAPAKRVDSVLADIKQSEEAEKIQASRIVAASDIQDSFPVGTVFPDFNVKDLDDKPLSIAGYKGKVVMLDFWATWCGPCVGEVPNVAAVYAKYHDKGFEIIGISLDQAGAKDKVLSFTQAHNMPWRQFYDGKFWSNELAVKYGVRSIPATYLLDGTGKIIAKNVRGATLEPAVKKALGID